MIHRDMNSTFGPLKIEGFEGEIRENMVSFNVLTPQKMKETWAPMVVCEDEFLLENG